MSEVAVQMLAPGEAVSALMEQLTRGEIEDAIASFAEDFRFEDHGIGLKFSDKDRLTEFFRKTHELYPDFSLQTNQLFVIRNYVFIQWKLHGRVAEAFYAGLTAKIPVSISGVSIVRTEEGKITDWEDYYDGLTSRRTALAAHFTEWVEY